MGVKRDCMSVAERTKAIKLSPRKLSSVKAVIDALLPPLPAPKGDPHPEFWEHELSSDPDYLQVLQEAILHKVPKEEAFLLEILLYLMSTVIGSALIFGSMKPIWARKAFSDYDTTEEKTAALKSLQVSRFQVKQKIFNGLKRLVCGIAFSFVPKEKNESRSARSMNPFWPGIGYQGPCHWKLSPEEDTRRIKEGGMVDFRSRKNVMIQVEKATSLEADVVIVGSGSGGGVAADILASQGFSVLVVEKGPYKAPLDLSHLEVEAMDEMYEAHSLLTTSDGNIMVLAGATLGGGTTINWSCCLPLPDYVRQEWVNTYKLKHFRENGEFDDSERAVMDRICCADKSSVVLNQMNQKLKMGCEKMKYKWTKTGQNLRDTGREENGFICFGDRYGNKQSNLVTFLDDAIKNGAQIIDNCTVDEVIHGFYTASNGRRRKRALGVVGHVGEHKVTIRARKCVISAAGALNTPCLLQRSSLKNPHIGHHLHLHPVTSAVGFYEKEGQPETIDCFHGAPMTGVCGEFESGPKSDGYGAKLECPNVHTGLMAAALQFVDPRHFRQIMKSVASATPLVVLQRDTSEGQVRTSSYGRTPQIDYVVNPEDKKSMVEALKGAVKVLIASGAQRIIIAHMKDGGFTVPPPSDSNRDDEISNYLKRIDDMGMKDLEACFFCAHQMGSCRMSVSPDSGVVDTNGEMWECDDLYVFDTSVFPTASGANPMLSVLTVSHMLSTRLAMRLQHDNDNLTSNPEERQTMDKLRLCKLETRQAVAWTRSEKVWFVAAWSFVLISLVWMFRSSIPQLNDRNAGEEL